MSLSLFALLGVVETKVVIVVETFGEEDKAIESDKTLRRRWADLSSMTPRASRQTSSNFLASSEYLSMDSQA